LCKMSKRTNLDIKDAACLHIVHILQHPTSRTTKSAQTTIVNAPKQNFSLLTERSVFNTNQSERWPSCHIDPCVQLHDSPHRPRANGWDSWTRVWYVMEIDEKELDKEWCGSRAIFTKN
jgi:hypothetical protein